MKKMPDRHATGRSLEAVPQLRFSLSNWVKLTVEIGPDLLSPLNKTLIAEKPCSIGLYVNGTVCLECGTPGLHLDTAWRMNALYYSGINLEK